MTDLTRQGLVELADKVEQASEPDRELDAAISTAVDGDDWSGTNPHWMSAEELPRYTASLDATIALVPTGWDWVVYSDASCEIGRKPDRGAIMNPDFITEAATPALALCAAALRARAMETRRG